MSVTPIRRAFADVENSVSSILHGKAGEKDSALRAIFALNNEIGKLARLSPTKLGPLKMLQAYVNSITVAVKNGNAQMIRESLKSAREYLLSVDGELN